MKTVYRRGRGFAAREHGIGAKNRWWRDAASGARAAVCGRSFRRPRRAGWPCRGVPPQDRIGRECRSAAAVLLKPRVQFLDFARRERSDGAFNLLDGI